MRTSVQLLIGGLLALTGIALGACNLIFGVDELSYDSNTFGTGGAGGTVGSDCQTAFDCPAPKDECLDRVCDFGSCVVVDRPAGTLCPGGVCDGAGSCFQCGVASTDANPPPCPAVCSSCVGGSAGTCTIDCGVEDCVAKQVLCPAGYDCVVDCSSATSCTDTKVVCPDDNRACELVCEAINACVDATLECGVGPCSLSCGIHDGACNGVVMACGVQSCTASCQGSTAPALTGCADACNCETC